MVQAVKEDLLRVGCPEESAQSAEHLVAAGQIGDGANVLDKKWKND